MKQEDKQYEEWLSEIRNKQPILKNPEELTMAIINSVSQLSPTPQRRKFLIGAWLSGIAAAVLLLLCIDSTYLSSVTKQNTYRDWRNSTSSPLPENWEKMGLRERNDYLSSQFVRHRKLRQTRIIQLTESKQSTKEKHSK